MLTLEQYLRLTLFMLNCSIQVTAVLKGDEESLQSGGASTRAVTLVNICLLWKPNPSILPLNIPVQQGLLGFQPTCQAHENGVHVLALLWVLGRGLKQQHVVGVCKLEGSVGRHLYLTNQVTLVAHQYSRHSGWDTVPVALLDPRLQVLEWVHLSDIVNENDSVHIAVVVFYHALPEAFLSCSVPHLHLLRSKGVITYPVVRE